MKVYASVSSYILGRMLGGAEACRLITHAAETGLLPDGAHIPAAVTLHRLRSHADIALRVDAHAVCIGKTRSRHFSAALESDADAWLTIDDDIEADGETLAHLLSAVDSPEPVICVAPCALRNDSGTANVLWSGVYFEKQTRSGATVRSLRRAGFGLVVMNRAALKAVADASPRFQDERTMKPAPFLEILTSEGQWLGEDLSFFERVPRAVEVVGLRTGKTAHAGRWVKLEEVP